MYDDFFAKAHELVQKGVPFVTATVVWAEKPSSGKPGDKAIITIDGTMHGWIGGSCAQPTVIKEALKALEADEAKLIRLSTEPESKNPRAGLVDLPMTCFSGGTLEIYLEPQPPRPRLVIVGTLPVARALSQLARAMNYHVIVVDLDAQGEQDAWGEHLPFADETLSSLDGIGGQIRPFTYIVIATHGNYDELALEQILKAEPSYVGLVASPKRAEAVRAYLQGQGLTETDMLPLKAPAGLDIQARRGDEIALSIMAEIVQKRRNAELINLALFHQEETAEEEHEHGHHAHERDHHEHEHTHHSHLIQIHMAEPGGFETAVDPICGMDVVITTAKYTYEHEGQIYYFCCAGCREKFVETSRQLT